MTIAYNWPSPVTLKYPMLIKVIIVLIMLAIVYSLFSGLYFLVKDQGKSKRTVNSLSWRIGLSIGLFLLLIIAMATGLIEPHGLRP